MSPKLSDDQKEQRNLQILEAAKRAFEQKGYGATTLKDIVEEAGMSRGWIYLYFQSKEEIFEALLQWQDLQHKDHVDALIDSSLSIWKIILDLYSQQLEELLRFPDAGLQSAFYEYSLIGSRDEERRGLLMERYNSGVAQFARLIQIGVERGEFSPTMDPMDISRLAASYQEGIMTHTITVGTEKAKTSMQFEALTTYLRTLLHPAIIYKPEHSEEN
ncbi:TetR family transcriptional regulator [Paenibacillus pabuli]|uniref:TetR family transcriptional regulator n=1 Tax=Paenibacillus pabuli TaxID=1472 RepID=UPI00078081C6|nr:TetR family transcriptional regulator [Paenibacillus pabuli]MEC0128818.1 TetR family transcriptional regulator [Paenibacillus pabuli]